MKDLPYQDIWVDGKAVIKGTRECVFRYQAIHKFVKRLRHPIKVLDLGANYGYFSLRLASQFPGLFVLWEGNEIAQRGLVKLCKLNERHNAIVLSKIFSLDDLLYLAQEERFDLVLALSIIHHFNDPYENILKALTNLGTHLIFEPPIQEERTLNRARIRGEPLDLAAYPFQKIASVPTGSVKHSAYKRDVLLLKGNAKPCPLALKKSTFQAFQGIFPSQDSPSPFII